MKTVVILCMVVTAIYLLYYFRHYIRYFFSLLSVTKRNNKNIEKLKKQGMNIRKVNNEDIKKYVDFLNNKLIEKSLGSFDEFKIDQELDRHLKYSRFSEKYLEELFCKILNHLHIKREELDFEVEYLSSKKSYGYAGVYFEKGDKPKAKIHICVKNDLIYETVVSIIAHECCHHLLLSNDIKLKERIENECLTDTTAILTGFGKFMVKGYEISNRVIFEEEFLRLVDKDRVGYLSSKDIKYIMKKYIKY